MAPHRSPIGMRSRPYHLAVMEERQDIAILEATVKAEATTVIHTGINSNLLNGLAVMEV